MRESDVRIVPSAIHQTQRRGEHRRQSVQRRHAHEQDVPVAVRLRRFRRRREGRSLAGSSDRPALDVYLHPFSKGIMKAILAIIILVLSTANPVSAQFDANYMQKMQLMAVQSTAKQHLDTYEVSVFNGRQVVAYYEGELQNALNKINATPASPAKTAAIAARSDAAIAVSNYKLSVTKGSQVYAAYSQQYVNASQAITVNQFGLASTAQSTYPGYETQWFNNDTATISLLTIAWMKMDTTRTALSAL